MRILFFLRSINYDRHFEAVLHALLERGHHVHVALEIHKKGRQGDDRVFTALRERHPRFSWGLSPGRDDEAWASVATTLRYSTDYLRYLSPEYANAQALRERARDRAPGVLTGFADRSGPRAAAALDRTLRRLERAVPLDPGLVEYVKRHDPDVVLVSPLVGLGSPQGDLVRAAQACGVPTALLMASWDNLTNKGVIRDHPDATIVWNPAQVEEAVQLHGLPRASVEATGAHTYDQWFDWRPQTTRAEFCARVGLDPARPYLLYVGSSGFIAPHEADFTAEWIARLRASGHPELEDAGVLVRPHPANPQPWAAAGVGEPGRTVVWPPEGSTPTSVDTKAEYFDSIHHCAAVVGINTSALIESAIVGRGVFTVLTDAYRHTQEGTLHFEHLAGDDGLLTIAGDWPQHWRQVAAVAADDTAQQARIRSFLERFVRPHGLDVAATPRVVQAIERLARYPRPPAARGLADELVAGALARPVRAGHAVATRLPRAATRRVSPLRRPAPAAGSALRVTLVLDHPGLLIHFDETVRGLVERGHHVRLAFGRLEKFPVALEALGDTRGAVEIIEKVPRRRDAYGPAAQAVRAALDVMPYLSRAHAGARYSRAKWAANPGLPGPLRRLAAHGSLAPAVHRRLLGLLRALEESIPTAADVDRWLSRQAPDVLLVSPLVQQEAWQTDYLRSARRLGVPAALCVASWDNLTSKGLVRVVPDRVLVWNARQRDEAVTLHGIPPERVAITGAQPFDRWFGRSPSVPAQELRRALGLPTDRPFVLFVGSTRQKQAPGAEAVFVREWIAALRASGDPRLEDLAVLVRPHPTTASAWAHERLTDFEDVVVWRRDTPLPVLSDERAAYHDALLHAAAVVGINSSAMVEAAIAGRPVHTILAPEWRAMQEDLVHFTYLLPENGGFLRAARSLDEHVELLAADLRSDDWRAANERFVDAFARPHGRDRPALPFILDAIEAVARGPRPAPPQPAAAQTWLARAALLVLSHQQRARAAAIGALAAAGPRAEHELRHRAKALRRSANGGLRGVGARATATGLDALGSATRLANHRGRELLKTR